MRRLLALALLIAIPLPAASTEEMTWRELSSLVGRSVHMTMPKGAVIHGRITAVEPDGLVLQVRDTTDKTNYPKGRLMVPRAEVKAIGLEWKTKRWRVIGTICGAWIGLGLGGYTAFHTNSSGAALAALAAVGGGLTTLGYFAGSAADNRTTTVLIRE